MNKKTDSKIAYYMWTLFLVFLILKLVGTIDWSWWYITMPLWIGIPVVLVIALIMVPTMWLIKRKW